MTAFVGLLRAVNVGGTGKLPMRDLAALCEAAGFAGVRTYIASGNVVFRSDDTEAGVKAKLETALAAYAGRPVGVLVRSAEAMTAARDANPFPDAAANRVAVFFLDEAPGPDALAGITGQADEDIRCGLREIYIHYGAGMASSTLRIPAARSATARNMNTVAALATMAAALAD